METFLLICTNKQNDCHYEEISYKTYLIIAEILNKARN